MTRHRGTGKRKRLEAEARAARLEATHGTRLDVTLKRDCKAERIGGRATIGGGLTDADIAHRAALKQEQARGYLTPRSTREERAAWHALANEGWNA